MYTHSSVEKKTIGVWFIPRLTGLDKMLGLRSTIEELKIFLKNDRRYKVTIFGMQTKIWKNGII